MWNWAGNYAYRAGQIERPLAVADIGPLVVAAAKVHAVGTRHCFNDIADTPGGLLLSTQDLTGLVALETTGPATPTVTIESGVTYGRLSPQLHAAGWALPNLASLPHVTVAGATATATHGSGEANGCLSTSVSAIECVAADGSTRTLKRGDADFNGAVVHLGALGVVTRLRLDLVPTFEVTQHVYDGVPMAGFADNLDAIVASTYSISGFTDWQAGRFTQVWVKSLAGRPHFDLTMIGGTPADRPRHPLDLKRGNVASEGAGAAACTGQLGVPGPWHERLTHFRIDFTPSSGQELQSEYFIPRQHAPAALAAVATLADAIAPLVQISEVRFVAADELWLSPMYQRPSVGIHFTWRREPDAVLTLLPKIEAALAPFDPRPHWGKLFTMEKPARLYPQAQAFVALRKRLDPGGKFMNPYLERVGL